MLNYARERIRNIGKLSEKITHWIGSEGSILWHTFFFIGIFALKYVNFGFSEILLILTTAVSLEAIYLSIFIQMTVNRHTADIEDIQEDVQELGEGVEEIGEVVEELQEEDEEEEAEEEAEDRKRDMTFEKIESTLQKLMTEIETLKGDIRKGS